MLPITNVLFDLYRPFGAGAATTNEAKGLLQTAFNGLSYVEVGAQQLFWTHTLDVAGSMDIRDGLTRAAASPVLIFADGDEVRIDGPNGNETRFVVVYVETRCQETERAHKRAYLLRHSVTWPGP